MPNAALFENNYLHNNFESYSSHDNFGTGSWEDHNAQFQGIMNWALGVKSDLAKEVEEKKRENEMVRSFVFIDEYITMDEITYTDPIAEKGLMDKIMDILSSIGSFFQELGKLFFTVS